MESLETNTFQLDYIKLSMLREVREQMRRSKPFAPALIHTLPHCGLNPKEAENIDWHFFREIIEEAGSPLVAVHLDIRLKDWGAAFSRNYQDRTLIKRLMERMTGNLRYFQEQIPVPVLIENVPFNAKKHRPRAMFDPLFIRQVAREAEIGLLLDLGHAKCAAYHLGIDVYDYLEALPLEKVREIHLNGPRILPEKGMHDVHYPLQKEDYQVFRWAMTKCRPEIVTLEYGGVGTTFKDPKRNDKSKLLDQLKRIKRILKNTEAEAGIPKSID